MDNAALCLEDLSAMSQARIDQKIIDFARAKFPDISESLINRNVCEFITAYEADYKCSRCCMSLDMCRELINTNGYTYHLQMRSDGWVILNYARCEFNKKNGGRYE